MTSTTAYAARTCASCAKFAPEQRTERARLIWATLRNVADVASSMARTAGRTTETVGHRLSRQHSCAVSIRRLVGAQCQRRTAVTGPCCVRHAWMATHPFLLAKLAFKPPIIDQLALKKLALILRHSICGKIVESTDSRPRRYYLVMITDAGSVPRSTTR